MARWPYPVADLEAPPVLPGLAPAPPDFVGVGVQKAGTSWWFGLLADHPGVHSPASRPKELHHFARAWSTDPEDADPSAYHRWFARPAGLLAGEWTPRYLYDWWTPAMLARVAPEARFLVMLRDPVERYRSGLAFDQARGARPVALVSDDAFHRGLYGAQLARLGAAIPDEQVLVLQYERCAADPAAELDRTYRFLGLAPGHRPAHLLDHVGPRQAKPDLAPGVVEALREAYAPDLAALFARLPDLDPGLWSTARP